MDSFFYGNIWGQIEKKIGIKNAKFPENEVRRMFGWVFGFVRRMLLVYSNLEMWYFDLFGKFLIFTINICIYVMTYVNICGLYFCNCIN